MQRVVRIHRKEIARDKHGAAGAEGDVARTVLHRAGADGRGGVVTRARAHRDARGQTKLRRYGGQDGADLFVAFEQCGEPLLPHAADFAHLPAPAAILHVQQEHAARVRKVGAVHAAQAVSDVIFRKHDLRNAREVLRLVLPHPQNFGRGEARKCDVRRIFRELIPADFFVQVIRLRLRAAVVPQDGGADDGILRIEHDKPVHLAAGADAAHSGNVLPGEQLFHAALYARKPVLGVLFAPAALRIKDGVFLRDGCQNFSVRRDQQHFDGGCAEIDADVCIQSTCFPFFPSIHGRECC